MLFLPNSIGKWSNQIDWDFVKNSLKCNGSKDNKRNQQKSTGYGFSSSINMSRKNITNLIGVAEPRKREQTYKNIQVCNHFKILSKFGRSCDPVWLENTKIGLWEDPEYKDRQKQFASQLVPDGENFLESHYNACSNPNEPLGSHTDKHNPVVGKTSLSPVVVISRTCKDNTRYAVVGAMRKSICDVIKSIHQREDFINDVVTYVTNLGTDEQHYTFDSISKLEPCIYTGIDGVKSNTTLCHLDPQSFYQIYLYFIPLLAVRFNLSYGEIVSVQTTFEVLAKSHYYFGLVSQFMLIADEQWITDIMSHHRGYRFGFFFLNIMTSIESSHSAKQPPVRFNDYREFQCPSYDTWKNTLDRKIFICLGAQHDYNIQPKQKDDISAYRKVMNLLKECMKGAGDLTIHHSMGIMSLLEIIPRWFYDYAVISPTSRYMKYFREKYYIEDYNSDKCLKTMMNILHVLKENHMINMSLRTLENVLCKYYRICDNCQKSKKWRDMIMDDQPQIIVHEKGWSVGTKKQNRFYTNSIISKVMCSSKEHVVISEIYHQMNFGSDPVLNIKTKSYNKIPRHIRVGCGLSEFPTKSRMVQHFKSCITDIPSVKNFIVQSQMELIPVPKKKRKV